jgi:hypothetical protein
MSWRALWAVLVVVAPVVSAEELRGFMGFKFGMTKQEALVAEPTSKFRACRYESTAFCLERPVSLGNRAGKVQALFDTEDALVYQINVRFTFLDRSTDVNCEQLTRELSEFLIQQYGLGWTSGVPLTHRFEDGARIEFLSLCIEDAPLEASSGLHTIAFKHPLYRQFATRRRN